MSPFFARDRAILARQMSGHNFDPSLALGGASRCRHGVFRVLVCAPIARSKSRTSALRLMPFPTTFWLVCPHLSRRAGTVEANAGVKRLEQWLSDSSVKIKDWREYNHLHQIIRVALLAPAELKFLRRFKPKIFDGVRHGGVGGIKSCDNNYNVKCLHLQTASFLALGHHPGESWLTHEQLGPDNHCSNNYCAAKFLEEN